MRLTEEQSRFYDTFGFLKFPGLFKDDVGYITETPSGAAPADLGRAFDLTSDASSPLHAGDRLKVDVPRGAE